MLILSITLLLFFIIRVGRFRKGVETSWFRNTRCERDFTSATAAAAAAAAATGTANIV